MACLLTFNFLVLFLIKMPLTYSADTGENVPDFRVQADIILAPVEKEISPPSTAPGRFGTYSRSLRHLHLFIYFLNFLKAS